MKQRIGISIPEDFDDELNQVKGVTIECVGSGIGSFEYEIKSDLSKEVIKKRVMKAIEKGIFFFDFEE